MVIRTDCYLARLKYYRERYPPRSGHHFEIITRTVKSHLSPSAQLLDRAKKEHLPFLQYSRELLEEFESNPKAIHRLLQLKGIEQENVLFLVCYEKDRSKCHRTLVRNILQQIIRSGNLVEDMKKVREVIRQMASQLK